MSSSIPLSVVGSRVSATRVEDIVVTLRPGGICGPTLGGGGGGGCSSVSERLAFVGSGLIRASAIFGCSCPMLMTGFCTRVGDIPFCGEALELFIFRANLVDGPARIGNDGGLRTRRGFPLRGILDGPV